MTLAEQGIKTLDDFADLASDELLEHLPDSGINEEDANALIMAARAHWFEDEEAKEGEEGEAVGTDADDNPGADDETAPIT